MSSCIIRPLSAGDTACWKRTNESSSSLCKAQKVPRQRTSSRCNPSLYPAREGPGLIISLTGNRKAANNSQRDTSKALRKRPDAHRAQGRYYPAAMRWALALAVLGIATAAAAQAWNRLAAMRICPKYPPALHT